MAEILSALRPRPGWEKAAINPDASHATVDLTTVSSTGYTGPSYQPPKLSPHSDAGEFDQSPFKEAQQGHRLARATSPNSAHGGGAAVSSSVHGAANRTTSDGAAPEFEGVRADGRPAWDSRFFLERTAWETQPRTVLLRPPSTNAFPGSNVRRPLPIDTGHSGGGAYSDSSHSPGARRASVPGGLDGDTIGSHMGSKNISSTDGNGMRTTILPGLYVAAPPMWASPYGEASLPAPSRNSTSPGNSPGPVPGHAGAPTTAGAAGSGAQRPPRADLTDSYIGRAYSPDQSYLRTDSVGDSPGSRMRQDEVANTSHDGGVDGQGTHLPALERAGYCKAPASKDSTKEKEAQAAAGAKAIAQKAAILALGAVYLPAGAKLRATEARSTRDPSLSSRLVAAPPPLYARSCRSTDDDDGRRADICGRGGTVDQVGNTSPNGSAGIWRPSGRQPIPETAPPLRKSTQSNSEEANKEAQEDADRRRAIPRDPAIYSPDRYPIVGMGWFMPPEKVPPNPMYAGVKAKYLEARPPRSDDEGTKTLHMPDIHTKPWLNPGKHLITDSSAPPPKMTGTAGARPPYSFSPSATGTSMATGTLRSNKGTGRSGRSAGRNAGKGNGKKKRSISSRVSGSGSGGESDSEGDSEVDGDREVLAVIGGVRLMSMVRRKDLNDEARLEAEEDAEMALEDADAARRSAAAGQRQNDACKGVSPEAGDTPSSQSDAFRSQAPVNKNSRGYDGGDKDGGLGGSSQDQGGRGPLASTGVSEGVHGGYNSQKSSRISSSDNGADMRVGSLKEDNAEEGPEVRAGRREAEQDREEEQEAATGPGGDDNEGAEYAGNDGDADDDNDSIAAAAAMAGLGHADGDADDDGQGDAGEDGDAEDEGVDLD